MWWILTLESNFILIVQRITYTQVKRTSTPFITPLHYFQISLITNILQ